MDGRPNRKNKAAFSNFTGVGGDAEQFLLSLLLLALTQERLTFGKQLLSPLIHLSK